MKKKKVLSTLLIHMAGRKCSDAAAGLLPVQRGH